MVQKPQILPKHNYKKNENMEQKIINISGLLFFTIIIIYSYCKSRVDHSELKKTGVMSKAKITGQQLTKSTLLIKFRFSKL